MSKIKMKNDGLKMESPRVLLGATKCLRWLRQVDTCRRLDGRLPAGGQAAVGIISIFKL
jgi:hypothetical protein